MIDLFTIFSKGGIVLWCFQGTKQTLTPSMNSLIGTVFLQERSNVNSSFNHDNMTLRFLMDNEFELIFVVAYQNIVQLSYADKLLSDVQLEFRDRYKCFLEDGRKIFSAEARRNYDGFATKFSEILKKVSSSKPVSNAKMRTFEESQKSQKTIASIIQQPGAPESVTKLTDRNAGATEAGGKSAAQNAKSQIPVKRGEARSVTPTDAVVSAVNGGSPKAKSEIEQKREEFLQKMTKGNKPNAVKSGGKATEGSKKKQARVWDGTPGDVVTLDYSSAAPVDSSRSDGTVNGSSIGGGGDEGKVYFEKENLGSMKGELPDMEVARYNEDAFEEDEKSVSSDATTGSVKGGSSFGLMSAFRSLVGSKKLTGEDIAPVLEKMREHLIGKNVAADIADKLCQSIAAKLEGKVIGTFSGVASTVKETLRESLLQLLSPKRRINILRDILEARKQKRPFTVVFCGVNGVGKSTNLAKITFWLTENGFKVLIAACDTFRAGAVEQLRTHTRHLNALHPDSVFLFEQGYGKDAAGIALQAVTHATERNLDVVLVDTAGRMQDNEPLMRALAKLIRVNEPDLVLFVGEALVGNEAVDQLVKFNQALADHAAPGASARLIDGIVLTKFDTIDDKVGAAISMTYITGQPIVFVGTGQTYTDLKNLNANTVVQALLK